MVEIKKMKWEDLDIRALAEISAEVRKHEGLGDYTIDQAEDYLRNMNDRFPIEIALLAVENNQVQGWLGIERVTEQIGEIGRWQPFIVQETERNKIAKQLISQINNYAQENGVNRMEIGFGGLSESNLATYRQRQVWFENEGWNKLEDTNFMACSPSESESHAIELPNGFDLKPLLEFDNDAIFECYNEAFTTGDARWIFDMTKEQRREEFEKLFDRSGRINSDASFVCLFGDAIVGFILVVTRSEDEEHLESIGVHPKYRGKGLGKTMLGVSKETLRKRGAQNFTLGVDPVNIPAVKLYERFQFNTVSRIARYSWKTSDP